MKISEIEQQTLDIDWFFTDGENIAFVASGGGKLPLSVSSSRDDTSFIANFCRLLSPVSSVMINPKLSKINPDFDERYFEDFREMAKKGFFAFDKTVLSNFSELSYHLVASPQTPLKIKDLPPEIAVLIGKTQIKSAIDKNFNLIQFDLLS